LQRMKEFNSESIMRMIEAEAAARRSEGPRAVIQSRIYIRSVEKMPDLSIKRETLIFRLVKRIQLRIKDYPFYSFAYNTAYKFKEVVPRYQEHIPVQELLKYHDAAFIANAYRVILKRDPDQQGLEEHLAVLGNGQLSKVEIIKTLQSSPEGKGNKVKLKGLRLRFYLERAKRFPIVGNLMKRFTALLY
jgi:uncharacterized protein DUF4214